MIAPTNFKAGHAPSNGATTFSTMSFGVMTFSTMTFVVMTFSKTTHSTIVKMVVL
jgi:hypothetical protein